MIDYKSDIVISRPVEQVYKLVTDVDRYDAWTDMSGTHLVQGDALRLGSQVVTTINMGPLKPALVFQVTDLEENRRLGLKTISKGVMDWDSHFTLESQGPALTRLTSSGQLRFNGLLKLLEPIMAGEVRNGEAKELVKFKNLLESA